MGCRLRERTRGALQPGRRRPTLDIDGSNAATKYDALTDGIRPVLDVDGNGMVDALTNGRLIIRYMFGLRGAALTAAAVAANAGRTPAQIETYIQSLMP